MLRKHGNCETQSSGTQVELQSKSRCPSAAVIGISESCFVTILRTSRLNDMHEGIAGSEGCTGK